MDRLSALDAEFLDLEDGVSHMHIAGMSVFEGSPPTEAEVGGLLAAALDRIPRYRQRVHPVPLGLGRPVWVDDPTFDLAYHVRATALAEPTDQALCHLMGRLMAQELDRTRPLWEVWVVHGLPDDRWALVSKVHHCMVDGVAGVGLLEVLLDTEPEAPRPLVAPWDPRPAPGGAALVLDAWGGLALDAGRRVGKIPGLLRHPCRAVRDGRDAAAGLARLASGIVPTPTTSIDGTIGAQRSWAHATSSLAEVKQIRRALGGTVNDVVLTAIAGGYRDLLIARGDDLDAQALRTLIPVSVRRPGDAAFDNHVSAILYELPIQVADPAVRLHVVRTAMTHLKESHMAEAGEAVTSAADLLPPLLVSAASRALMRISRDHPQRSLDTVTTNVPGPQFPLYCLGRRMLEHRPFVPITHGIRTATAILSYDGTLSFGVTGDRRAEADVATIAAGITATIDELALRSTFAAAS
jgi:diacylglycerol O-acyltransferase